MHRLLKGEIGAPIHFDTLRVLGTHWLIIALLHAILNIFLLFLLQLGWPTEKWPYMLRICVVALLVFLAMAGVSAAFLKDTADKGNGTLRLPNKLTIWFLVVTAFGYSLAWAGMALVTLIQAEVAQIVDVTLSGLLLALVSARFSSVLGSIARVVLVVQLLSVVVGLWLQPDEWTDLVALNVVLGTAIILGISLHGSRQYMGINRMRQRQARLQKRLRRRNETLAEDSISKSRLFAMASHDLRQPVHALGLLMERLRRDPQANLVRERVEVINSVVGALSETLENLMALAKFDAGTVPLNLRPIVLDQVFTSLLQEFEPIAVEKGLTFECELGGYIVHTDSTLLRTMICNLLANAIRYSHRGTVRASAALLGDGRTVRVQISDDGVGIPTERIPDIFEAFVRLGAADSGSSGLGLGLVITRRSAELLNVPIHVQSEVGKGTIFSLDLPISLNSPTQVPAPAVGAADLRGLRVLILDNDQVVLSSMAQTFEEWGCRIITGATADEVEVKVSLTSKSLDLIIIDYHLGSGVTGIDVIWRLRRACGVNVPAIVLTGDVAIHLHGDVDESNIVVAHKPLSPARLFNMVVNTVGKRDC